MGWTSKDLGDGGEAFTPTNQIQEAYLALAKVRNLPVDFAVFSHYDLRRNVVTAYFTPSAKELGAIFGATPCDKPANREGFALSVGDMRVWGLLFPEGRAE